MLTAKQIKSLPKGKYPNCMLMEMFPKQQGKGRSCSKQVFFATGLDKKKRNREPK